MTSQVRKKEVQLTVIGSGLAGFAASIFALERGITTAQIGNTGALAYTTGYFDLLGAHGGILHDDPWAGVENLRRHEPNHPLARISDASIRAAFQRFIDTLGGAGLEYTEPGARNVMGLLPGGVTKPTLCIPKTMLAGVAAATALSRALIVDFDGLQGFSAREFVANTRASWPNLRAATLGFTDMESGSQIYVEVMARALEVGATRKRLSEQIKAELGDVECVGLPAILGVHNSGDVHAEMEKLVGVPIFEIPTMPPAVPGIRLRETLEQALPARGLMLASQHKVRWVEFGDAGVVVGFEDNFGEIEIESKALILATGRFLSGGLTAERDQIRETLVGLDVSQPESRANWHKRDYFDARGHPINRSGIEIDEAFRPLSANGKPKSERLFAAGTILANQDWVRQRCGAGVAFASAHEAVEAASNLL